MTASKDKAGNIFARQNTNGDFPENATSANPVYFRTYSRFDSGTREQWGDTCARTVDGIAELGQLTDEEKVLLYRNMRSQKCLPSGRWMWIGGTEWIKKPENYYGSYNCSSTNITDWQAFGLMMNLAMQGCGTGAILEPKYIEQLPKIINKLNVRVIGEPGLVQKEQRQDSTTINVDGNSRYILVGDSRQGWVDSYVAILKLSSDTKVSPELDITVDISNVRPKGERLKSFGGVANPLTLPDLYPKLADILNGALGRKLNSVECSLLIDEAASVVVAGSIRRCLPEGALVHTKSGLVPIEKVRIGDRVLTSDGYYPVTNFFKQGLQSLCKIKTEDGFFECTAEHQIAVLTDVFGSYNMVKAKDLRPGDRLIFVPDAIPGSPTELPESKDISIPALTKDIAYFLGYFHGNGSVKKDKYRISLSVPAYSENICEYICNILKTSFDVETRVVKPEQKKANAFEIVVNSKDLNKYMGQFKQSFTEPVIPDCILLGTREIRESYLVGLADADGCHSQGVLVANTYPNFLRKVQAIYSSLGVCTRLCHSVRKRTGKWEGELVTVGENSYNDVHEIMSEFSLQYASQQREKPKSFKDHGFPRAMVKPLVKSTEYGFSNHQTQLIYNTTRRLIPKATDLVPVKVEQITFNTRIAETYDIEVANIHEFVCEGLLVHNSAGMRQFASNDVIAITAKDNLWQQNESGQWVIDPKRDALRMANHTRVFHHKPSIDECISAVTKQYYSGEGAIQWAGEAVARANADLLETSEEKQYFLSCYNHSLQNAQDYLLELMVKKQIRFNINELTYRMNLYGTNPCGEIILQNNFCNLSEVHLNQINPLDFEAQEQAFKAGALWVAALLHHKFVDERYQQSRELDPIVGVGFTGLFDFFVNAFGVDWLRWWQAGRPDSWGVGGKGLTHYYLSDYYKSKEQTYLERWSKIVHDTVWEYCERHNLKRPNRCTTTKPSGSQSLLTGASPGWHPPKAAYFIRRVTYAKNDPVALACVDFGYNITPSQSDKDENGVLLNDPYDPRCTEWLVEIPTKTNWADLEGVENIDISQFSALAQFDFYMQVQKYYTRHNTSATIELRENEIEELGERIYQAIKNDEGYISAALLARFDDYQSYPRLPFEPVSREEYNKLNAEVLARRKNNNFKDALAKYDTGLDMEVVLVACDGGKCELKQN